MEAGARTGAHGAFPPRACLGDDAIPGLPGSPGGSHHRRDLRPGCRVPQVGRRERTLRHRRKRACRTLRRPVPKGQPVSLFSGHKVKVFVYNQQVTDTLTESFLTQARKYGIPVVGVYETMPAPGYDYQSWMLAEITALHKAVADKISTQKL